MRRSVLSFLGLNISFAKLNRIRAVSWIMAVSKWYRWRARWNGRSTESFINPPVTDNVEEPRSRAGGALRRTRCLRLTSARLPLHPATTLGLPHTGVGKPGQS
jgi:hypothetical protein